MSVSRTVIEATDLQRQVLLPDGTRLDILSGIDLSLGEGESVAIVGRSGSGKSTLLSIIGLLTRADRGHLRISGRDVTRASDRQRAHIRNSSLGFVFQSYSLIRHLTAGENVRLPLRYGKDRFGWRQQRRRVSSALQAVGLSDRANSRPKQLSGGEQQRVAIARALVRIPAAILADEPTGALDSETAGAVLTTLRETAARHGTAMLIVTHDPVVADFADRVLLLDGGSLTERRDLK